MAGKVQKKSYEQFCPVARTLDLVGERWTLLIIRDLLMGPKRYTDLRTGLPGIASDILTARLRILQEAGFIRRRELPRPAPATVYELTDEGRELRHVVLALGRIGIATLSGPRPGEDIQPERILVGLRPSFHSERFATLTETYELTIDGLPFTVEVSEGSVDTRPGTASDPALRLRTDSDTLIRLLTRKLSPSAAMAVDDGRTQIEGEPETLERFTEAFAFGRRPLD